MDHSVILHTAPVAATSPRVQVRVPAELHAQLLHYIHAYNQSHAPAAVTIQAVLVTALREFLSTRST